MRNNLDSDLLNLREKITAIDRNILDLLSQRKDLALEVAKAKLSMHREIRDTAREEALLENLETLAEKYELDKKYISRIFRLIIDESVLLQQRWMHKQLNDPQEKIARLAFLGPKGSYSHIATRQFSERNFVKTVELAYQRFDQIIHAVEEGIADFAIVPLENSSSGAINEVYDLLQQTSLSIVGEMINPIDHCLMGSSPCSIEEITTVYSHSQPFQQCSDFLAHYPNWKIEYCESTAAAMEKVSNLQQKGHVAIGSQAGGELYGLMLIKKVQANQAQNMTRFIVLHRKAQSVAKQVPAKTTFLIATGQHAGALVEALMILKEHNIIMTKLESRPMKGNPWEEMFYIDVQANLESIEMQNAIKSLQDKVRALKILGSYPSETVVAI